MNRKNQILFKAWIDKVKPSKGEWILITMMTFVVILMSILMGVRVI